MTREEGEIFVFHLTLLIMDVPILIRRQAFLVRIGEAEKNLAAGKTKEVSVDDLIASI